MKSFPISLLFLILYIKKLPRHQLPWTYSTCRLKFSRIYSFGVVRSNVLAAAVLLRVNRRSSRSGLLAATSHVRHQHKSLILVCGDRLLLPCTCSPNIAYSISYAQDANMCHCWPFTEERGNAARLSSCSSIALLHKQRRSSM